MAGAASTGSHRDHAGRVRDQRDEPRTFRLLYVCTGNICRSPFAEILTREILLDRLGGPAAAAFHISSAGVHAVAGASIHPDTREELRPWGLDRSMSGRFVAQQLRPVMVEQSDLVLGMDRRHRAAVVEYAPAALATAFSLREFARLAASVDPAGLPAYPVARARALVEHALGRRGMVPPASPDEDQVPDPMGGPPRGHRVAAVLIQEAVESIVDIIAPAVRRTR